MVISIGENIDTLSNMTIMSPIDKGPIKRNKEIKQRKKKLTQRRESCIKMNEKEEHVLRGSKEILLGYILDSRVRHWLILPHLGNMNIKN